MADITRQVLESDLEELDNAEFNIPKIEVPPSLEEILNEPDDASSLSEEEGFDSQDPYASLTANYMNDEYGDTQSLVSKGSSSGSRSSKSHGYVDSKKLGVGSKKTRSSIFRHVILKGVSAQLCSASERVNAGHPTVVAVSSLVAVGTSHGLILVFDPSQTLRICLSSTEVGKEQGAVSALGFSHDSSRILSGHVRGNLYLYDVASGNLLQTVTDAHPPGVAVLHIRFTESTNMALFSDAGGSVFELGFRRVLRGRGADSRCLFSGSRGEVCCFEPLIIPNTHSLQDFLIVALATLSKVIVITIKPSLRVLFSNPLHCDPHCLPLLDWQFVVIQNSQGQKVIDPVLAFGRGRAIYFYQATLTSRDRIHFIPLQKLAVSYDLLMFCWLNARTMVTIDTNEQLHLIDVKTEICLEQTSITSAQLVYESSHFKGVATGGNVSKAMALAGDHACYNSIVCYGSQILVLGTKSFHVLTMRKWSDRLNYLVKLGHVKEAVLLALGIYKGDVLGMVDLPVRRGKRRQVVGDKLLELVHLYNKDLLDSCPETSDVTAIKLYYKEHLPVVVKVCLALGKSDLMFSLYNEYFCFDPLPMGVFLECLETPILNEELTYIPPAVFQQFVIHYVSQGYIQAIEACIINVDVSCLDIHQVMTLCWANSLYDAIITVYNKGLGDYVTPFEELMTELEGGLSTGELAKNIISLGNKLLVYVSCCLAGRAYPRGNIPAETADQVQSDILRALTAIHSKNARESELVYPYLRTFLGFDTREFFNVLSLAFDDPDFCSKIGNLQRQRIVDIMIQIMVGQTEFDDTQVGALFTFLARQLSRPRKSITLTRDIFDKIFNYLTSSSTEDSRHGERQQTLLELYNSGGIIHCDEDKLLESAKAAMFYQVCEMIYEKRGDIVNILQCYILDESRSHLVFDYIWKILASLNDNEEERKQFERDVLDRLTKLLDIDNHKAAGFVVQYCPQQIVKYISEFKGTKFLYPYLQGVFEHRESHSGVRSQLMPQHYELYLELLCQHSPHKVDNFIRYNDCYRLDPALEICQRYDLTEPTAYLLEKRGNIKEALTVLLDKLKQKLEELTGTGDRAEFNSEKWTSVQAYVMYLVNFCQRNSQNADLKLKECLWISLLDEVLLAQREKVNMHEKYLARLRDLTHNLMTNTMNHLPLQIVLDKVLKDPAYHNGPFREIRALLLGMLESYHYDVTLLSSTTKLLYHDAYSSLQKYERLCSRGQSSRQFQCQLCHKDMWQSEEVVVAFSCCHRFHFSCLTGTDDPDSIHYELKCSVCSVPKETDSSTPEGVPCSLLAQLYSERKNERTRDPRNLLLKASSRKSYSSYLDELIDPKASKQNDPEDSYFSQQDFSLKLQAPAIPHRIIET